MNYACINRHRQKIKFLHNKVKNIQYEIRDIYRIIFKLSKKCNYDLKKLASFYYNPTNFTNLQPKSTTFNICGWCRYFNTHCQIKSLANQKNPKLKKHNPCTITKLNNKELVKLLNALTKKIETLNKKRDAIGTKIRLLRLY